MWSAIASRPGLVSLGVLSLGVVFPPVELPATDGVEPSRGAPRPPRVASDTLDRVADEARKGVVLLEVETRSGSRQGSGFIVDAAGRIFTNHHVVEGAREIRVKLASGDVYERVEILGVDERRDIAVLKVPGFELPALPLGNSDSVRVGESVIAIGSPLGLENTVSNGIVSGRRTEPEGYSLLQITAPTSQGSSGGPVLVGDGRVIGIAVSQMRDGQNLNFAVPINYARGLSAHLDGRPLAVLGRGTPASDRRVPTTSAGPPEVNRELSFELEAFRGFTLETDGRVGGERRRRTRVIYRRIESVGGPPRIERYAVTETTDRTGPFGTPQTVRRERSRAIVSATDLRPIAVQGETAWWDGAAWHDRRYSLEFDGYHVTGTVTDTAGEARELDRTLPRGILLESTRHLAFATLAEDSLVGRSVEFVTFDAATGETTTHRYDVRGATTVRLADREIPALLVNLASGLDNTTVYFRRDLPRVLLRSETSDSDAVEEVSELRLHGPGREPPPLAPGGGDEGDGDSGG